MGWILRARLRLAPGGGCATRTPADLVAVVGLSLCRLFGVGTSVLGRSRASKRRLLGGGYARPDLLEPQGVLLVSVVIVTGSAGSDRLRGGSALRRVGAGRRRHRQRHARSSSSAPRRRPRGTWSGSTSDLGDGVHAPRRGHPRPGRARGASSSATASDIALVIHTAAQPCHDWAARDPFTDFDVNAGGTLNMLQNVRAALHRGAVHLTARPTRSTATGPTRLPLVELETRWEIEPGHPYDERHHARTCRSTPCLHCVFGASKVAADVMVQEYGRYFGMKTACFRGGTLTGPAHSATELHGFLGLRDALRAWSAGTYRIFGYKGKQVRDAIHSHDVITAFEAFFRSPRVGRGLQPRRRPALQRLDARGDRARRGDHRPRQMVTEYHEANRVGDHIWWIGVQRALPAGLPGLEAGLRRADDPARRSTRPTSTSGPRKPDRDRPGQAERPRRAGRRRRLRQRRRQGHERRPRRQVARA